MAPEIRLDEHKIYDSKVDMYSFGLMMWEMWFGEMVPFEAISWSQDEVTLQIDKRKQREERRGGTLHPPSYKMDRIDGVLVECRAMREENCDGK